MIKRRSMTALATLAVAFGFGGAAQADPFADTALEIQRVTFGMGDDNRTMLRTFFDNGDDGVDATSAPNSDVWNTAHWSTLGIDQNGTMDTSDDVGGYVVLEFTDNVCLTDAGMDLDLYDAQDDESAFVEVSYDGGVNYHDLGEAGPGAYELDADGVVPFFTQMRLTASDRSGKRVGNSDLSSGIDVDAVECLNSVSRQGFAFDEDTCDMTSGDAGTDVDFVVVHSDGYTAYVELFLCGSVVDASDYVVHFASPDTVEVASVETTTDWVLPAKKSSKANARSNGPQPNQSALTNADGNARFNRTSGGSSGACGMVPQHTVTYSGGVDSGGLVFVGDGRLSVEVTYAEMNAFQGDNMMVWVETVNDNAPETDPSDGCDNAEVVDEAVSFTLN